MHVYVFACETDTDNCPQDAVEPGEENGIDATCKHTDGQAGSWHRRSGRRPKEKDNAGDTTYVTVKVGKPYPFCCRQRFHVVEACGCLRYELDEVWEAPLAALAPMPRERCSKKSRHRPLKDWIREAIPCQIKPCHTGSGTKCKTCEDPFHREAGEWRGWKLGFLQKRQCSSAFIDFLCGEAKAARDNGLIRETRLCLPVPIGRKLL